MNEIELKHARTFAFIFDGTTYCRIYMFIVSRYTNLWSAHST